MPSHQEIDINFARIGLRDFFASSQSRMIRFFSAGEPTQAFEKMVEIHEIAKKMAGTALRTELETNGYFSKEIAKWIENNVDILWISCDGPPEIQDAQRPRIDRRPSSEVVNENVWRFAHCKKMQFGVRATISRDNISRQDDLIEYFHSLGVRYVAASPTYHSTVNPNIKTPSLVEFAKYFVPAFYRALDLGMFYQTLLMVNFDEEVDIYCQACLPTPRLTTDGYVSCCDWACFGSPMYLKGSLADLVYGQYDKVKECIIYNQEKIARIKCRNAEYLSKQFCKGCEVIHHCVGGCVGKMICETGELYKASSEWCDAVRYLFKNLPIGQRTFPYLHP